MQFPSYIKTCMDLLTNSGYRCYIVGGAVRDSLLKREIFDYDLTTDALPDQMRFVFQHYKTIPTGIKHGTLTVVIENHPVEITTFRTDGTYQNHRHPSSITFTHSLKEDCARRDFTINALAYHPSTGICDFFGGQQDLKNQILRTVGNPNERFEEDALRILRALRFAAQLGFQIEPHTRQAIFAHAQDLFYISLERITEEFGKLIEGIDAPRVLLEYKTILEVFLPELKKISLEDWNATLTAIAKAPQNRNLRIALLYTPLKDSFYQTLYQRLRLSNANADEIRAYIKYKDAPIETRIDMRKLLSQLPIPYASYFTYRALLDSRINQEACERECMSIIKNEDCISLKQLAIHGDDLKKIGYQNEQIGILLQECLNAVMENKVRNQKDALLQYIQSSKIF